MDLFFFLLRASRRTVALAVLAGIVGGVSTMGVLVLIRLWMSEGDDALALVAGLFVAVCASAVLSRLASQYLLISLSRRAVAQLGATLSRRVLGAPLRHLEELGPNRLQAILTADVPAIAQGLNAVPLLCANGAIIVACLAFLAWLSVPVSLMVVGLLAVGFLVQRALMRRAQGHMGLTREGQENVIGQVRHLIDGIKELKVHRPRREAFLRDGLHPAIEYQERQSTRSQFLMTLANSWGRVMFFLLIGFLLFVFPHVAGVDRQAVGVYFIAVFFTMIPLEGLKQTLPMLSRAKASLDKVEVLGLDLEAVAQEDQDARAAGGAGWEGLELAGVTHSYRRERDDKGFTLGPINLAFRPGELVYLAGGNGSGKTTLAKVLVGLYRPEGGEVRLDGRPVAAEGLDGYRQMFSVVFSEFHLFPTLFGHDAAAVDGRAAELLRLLHLDKKVRAHKGVLNNVDRLSRGQRKRVALLAALLEDRPFYVFDEWAADQDPHFKDVFYTQILPGLKARGKAALVISHDDRYYRLADRLLYLEDGKLRAGTPSAEQPGPALADVPPA